MVFKTNPYEHQKKAIEEGINRIYEDGFYALFMEVGVGKSKSSIDIYQNIGFVTNVIVICPKALYSTWKTQLETHSFLTNKDIGYWYSNKIKSKSYQKEMEKKCLIVNVEAFSTKNEYLENRISEKLKTGSIVILDESTKIKSPKAGRTKRIIKMFESAKYKLILTGTEITNSLFDIYSQFQFLKKNFWESKRREWKNYYLFSHYFGEFQKVKMGAHIEFDKLISYRRINELLETIKPHCYRIRKNECLDLPDKIYQDIEIEMNSEQRRIYTELRNDMTTQYQGQELSIETKISLFTRCRQITGGFMPESGQSIGKSNPKLDFILAECENKSKAIIWCSFRPEIEFITKRLNEELGDGSAVPFYGGMKKQEEIEAQEKFRDDPNCYYFVASCAKGAFGLNLQFSSLSYFFTKSLSIEHVEQCEGRQHRAGQVNKVTYKNLICKNSIDEHIKKLLERGMSLVNAVKDMTIDDIFKIV